MITIEKVGNRIHLRSPYPTAGLAKTVPGSTFNKGKEGERPYWSLPLSLSACKALRDRFGQGIEIGPDLWIWAKAERDAIERLGALANAADAELRVVPEVAPRLAAAMSGRTYQRVGARYIAEGRNVLLADQPGLGKTLEALGGILELEVPGPYLVVCPKTAVESVWANEIPRWIPGATVVTTPDGRERRDTILDNIRPEEFTPQTWYVIHPEMVRTKSYWICRVCKGQTPRKAGKCELACGHDPKGHTVRHDHTFPQLFQSVWGAIIADESDRSLLRATGKLTQTRIGMELLRDLGTRPDGVRIAVSGTPFRGRPHLLWSTLNWLWPDRYSAFWSWVELYWEVEDGGWGGSRTIGKLRADREEELWDSLKPVVLRRTKAEVAPDLPAKSYMGTPLTSEPNSPIGVWLTMGEKQRKAYDQMLDSSFAEVDGGTLSAVGILAELTRLKQFSTSSGRMEERTKQLAGEDEAMRRRMAARRGRDLGPDPLAEDRFVFRPALPSNKLDWLEERLVEWGFPEDPDTKVVVVSQFTQTLELFAAELSRKGIASAMLTGNVVGRNRTNAIERFNTEQGPHLMFLNTKAGGVAITIDTADRMVFLDETWIPDDQEQAEDRIHRVSRPRPVQYYYLRSQNSVEEAIALVNLERDMATKRLLDGRRGVEYARWVMDRTRSL